MNTFSVSQKKKKNNYEHISIQPSTKNNCQKVAYGLLEKKKKKNCQKVKTNAKVKTENSCQKTFKERKQVSDTVLSVNSKFPSLLKFS